MSPELPFDSMSARLLPGGEIEHVQPPPYPEPMNESPKVTVAPITLTMQVNELVRIAMRLQQSGPSAFLEAPYMKLVAALLKLQKLTQPVLIGADDAPEAEAPAGKKARCTEWEACQYCREIGLPPEDGSWFVAKMEGIGWKINKAPVKNALAVIRAWKLAGHMPSQKESANQAQKPLVKGGPSAVTSNQLDGEIERLRRLK